MVYLIIGIVVSIVASYILGIIIRKFEGRPLSKVFLLLSSSKILRGITSLIFGLLKLVLLYASLDQLCGIISHSEEQSILFSWLFIVAFVLKAAILLSLLLDIAWGPSTIFGYNIEKKYKLPYVMIFVTAYIIYIILSPSKLKLIIPVLKGAVGFNGIKFVSAVCAYYLRSYAFVLILTIVCLSPLPSLITKYVKNNIIFIMLGLIILSGYISNSEPVFTNTFLGKTEASILENFPAKMKLAKIKSLSELYLLQKKDIDKVYYQNGHLSKMEYPLSQKKLDIAATKFNFINDTYLKPNGITPFFSLIPDKNYFLAEKNGYLSMNYDLLEEDLKKALPEMTYISIKDSLCLDDYYYTDTHWRQEKIGKVADILLDKMGNDSRKDYDTQNLDVPFYGVYYDQANLPLPPDNIKYISNPELDSCTVTNYDSGKPVAASIYDTKKSTGRDPYEFFLSGATPLIVIDNPASRSDRELIMFRDSFGSSLAPWLVQGYKKVTLVDIRYIQSVMLGQFVDFSDSDVLFIYSSLLINNSLALK